MIHDFSMENMTIQEIQIQLWLVCPFSSPVWLLPLWSWSGISTKEETKRWPSSLLLLFLLINLLAWFLTHHNNSSPLLIIRCLLCPPKEFTRSQLECHSWWIRKSRHLGIWIRWQQQISKFRHPIFLLVRRFKPQIYHLISHLRQFKQCHKSTRSKEYP